MYEPGGAPKQWVVVPEQRDAPPVTLPVVPRARAVPGGRPARHRWDRTVLLAALAGAIVLVALLGTGASVADTDGHAPPTLTGTRPAG